MNKGQFKKGDTRINRKGAPKKQNGEILEYDIVATAQNMPTMPTSVTQEDIKKTQGKFIEWGNDNLFPSAVAQLNRKSPIHRGILNWKTIYISGKGFTAEKDKNFVEWLKKCNANGESLKKVIRKVVFDKCSSGNAFIELVKLKEGKFYLYHKDYTTCRVSKDEKSIFIYNDWANYTESKKDDLVQIPVYPEFKKDEKGVERSIIHIKDYEPEFQYYGIAGWVSAMDAAGIAYKTNKWNISRLDNSFSSSGVLVVEGNITPKAAKEMKKEFKTEYTGEEKQGKVMFMVKALGGGETKFTPFTSNNEGDWKELHKQSAEDLIIAHSWFLSLSGATYNSGFDVGRIRNDFQVAINTVISEEQESYLDVLKPIFNKEGGFDVDDFDFINEIPFDNDYTDKQVDSMKSIVYDVAISKISRDSGLNLLKTGFGLSAKEAESIMDSSGNGFKPNTIIQQ